MATGTCWDCGKTLRKGEGKMVTRQRSYERKPQRHMVCRDQAECHLRRDMWKAKSQAQFDAAYAKWEAGIAAESDEEQRASLLTVGTAGEW